MGKFLNDPGPVELRAGFGWSPLGSEAICHDLVTWKKSNNKSGLAQLWSWWFVCRQHLLFPVNDMNLWPGMYQTSIPIHLEVRRDQQMQLRSLTVHGLWLDGVDAQGMLQFLAFVIFTSTHYKEKKKIWGQSWRRKNPNSYFKLIQFLFLLSFHNNSLHWMTQRELAH